MVLTRIINYLRNSGSRNRIIVGSTSAAVFRFLLSFSTQATSHLTKLSNYANSSRQLVFQLLLLIFVALQSYL